MRPLLCPGVELAQQLITGSDVGRDPLLDQGEQQGFGGGGAGCGLGEPEARADHGRDPQAGGPVEGEGLKLPALVFTAHQQQITAHPEAEITDQGIPHQRHQRAAEHCRCGPIAGAANTLIGLDEALNLLRVLQEQANGGDLVQQGVCSQLLHLDVQLRCSRGKGLVALECWPCCDASLTLLFQSFCHQQAGGALQPSVADQQQGHRSRSSLESQPNPTTPSRMLRSTRRVR